jgi:hypothetical protein
MDRRSPVFLTLHGDIDSVEAGVRRCFSQFSIVIWLSFYISPADFLYIVPVV